MTFRKACIRFALLGGLMGISAGLLPAPMCPDCKTPGAFSAYMAKMDSQPSIFSQIWSAIIAVL